MNFRACLNKSIWISGITWLTRLLVGGVFVISGFLKAIDPWGNFYKFNDYLQALSLDIWPNLVLVGAFGLSCLEFLVGIFLIFGCSRRYTPFIALLIMCFMLPLTLWVAISNPVEDCGCFGEAIILSNWATFWKNVVLFAGTLWLVKYNKRIHWLVSPALQWLVILSTVIFILLIEYYGYSSQPMLDFRPYKVGEKLIDDNSRDVSQPTFVFIYEKDGKRIEVGENQMLPDEADGWKFVDRREIYPEMDKMSILAESDRNIRIWSKDGKEDVTEEAIEEEGKELIVMMPDLKEVSPSTTWKLNSLFEWAENHDVEMIGVVSGSPSDIAEWEDISMASYPIYTADDTQIKEVVRGNPAIVYLIDGEIKWKSTLRALDVDDFMSPEISGDALNFEPADYHDLLNCIFVYLSFMAVLMFLSFLPGIKKFYLPEKVAKSLSHKKC